MSKPFASLIQPNTVKLNTSQFVNLKVYLYCIIINMARLWVATICTWYNCYCFLLMVLNNTFNADYATCIYQLFYWFFSCCILKPVEIFNILKYSPCTPACHLLHTNIIFEQICVIKLTIGSTYISCNCKYTCIYYLLICDCIAKHINHVWYT